MHSACHELVPVWVPITFAVTFVIGGTVFGAALAYGVALFVRTVRQDLGA